MHESMSCDDVVSWEAYIEANHQAHTFYGFLGANKTLLCKFEPTFTESVLYSTSKICIGGLLSFSSEREDFLELQGVRPIHIVLNTVTQMYSMAAIIMSYCTCTIYFYTGLHKIHTNLQDLVYTTEL